MKDSVNALVVAEKGPGLGVAYILDHCLDSEEDIKRATENGTSR